MAANEIVTGSLWIKFFFRTPTNNLILFNIDIRSTKHVLIIYFEETFEIRFENVSFIFRK